MNTKVRSYLIELARKRTNQTVTYQVLCDDCKLGLDMSQPYDRKIIGRILGEISAYECNNKRPLISSLVVRKGDGYEGDGFFKLGEELGFGKWEKLRDDGIFEYQQMTETINKWSDNDFYNKHK